MFDDLGLWLPDWIRDVAPVAPAFLFPGCGCCEGCGTIDISSGCDGCTEIPGCYEFSIAGVQNGSCTNCNNWNRTIKVESLGGCLWVSGFLTAEMCNEDFIAAELGFTGGGDPRWELRLRDTPNHAYAIYRVDGGAWDCLATNIMSLDSSSARCTGWPNEITVEPA